MKASRKIITVLLAGCLSVFALGGCASSSKTADSDSSESVAPVLDHRHDGRYEEKGADGCYSCHGKGDLGDPIMRSAMKMPTSHYLDENRDSKQINDEHLVCISCHAQSE